jgi:hypothetical protein
LEGILASLQKDSHIYISPYKLRGEDNAPGGKRAAAEQEEEEGKSILLFLQAQS